MSREEVFLKSFSDYSREGIRTILGQKVIVAAQFIGGAEEMGPLLSLIRKEERLDRVQKAIDEPKLLLRNPWLCRLLPYLRLLNITSPEEDACG